jgi:hypothetical protein
MDEEYFRIFERLIICPYLEHFPLKIYGHFVVAKNIRLHNDKKTKLVFNSSMYYFRISDIFVICDYLQDFICYYVQFILVLFTTFVKVLQHA